MKTELNNEIPQSVIESNERFIKDIKAKMTLERAERIKRWRVSYRYNWGTVAFKAYPEWGNDALWTPTSNRVAGRVLCVEAATLLGEDHTRPAWNS
jgi:hypothetical protein